MVMMAVRCRLSNARPLLPILLLIIILEVSSEQRVAFCVDTWVIFDDGLHYLEIIREVNELGGHVQVSREHREEAHEEHGEVEKGGAEEEVDVAVHVRHDETWGETSVYQSENCEKGW